MQVARLCRSWQLAAPILRSTIRPDPILFKNAPVKSHSIIIRTLNQDAKFTRRRRVIDLRPQVSQPKEKADLIGKAALGAFGCFGVGALVYYGIGLGKGPSTLDHAVVWPDYIKERLRATYGYFGASLAVSVASAAVVLRSPVLLNLVARNGWMAILGSIALMVGSGEVCRRIPYQSNFGAKHVAWLVHSGIVGAVIAPIAFLGGPILIRAAWYTAGVVGGLSTIACCAPSERFLYMAGPLGMGLGVVIASSIGSMFLPPVGALGAGLYTISMYGGLIVMSGLVLYDTQRIVKEAESAQDSYYYRYDPINMSIGIYLDTINIFIRIATLLAGGGSRKK